MRYFDHNATTPLSPAAREAWLRAQDEAWQNPSSPHRAGARVKLRLDAARARLAQVLDTEPARIVFTGGATEAAGAILAHLARILPAGARIAVNPTEHPCVLAAVRERFAAERIAWLPVTREGVVTPAAVAAAAPTVAAVVVMAAQNETGVLEPWAEIAALCRQAQIPYVCDASQWLGKLPAGGLGAAAWLFGAGHKFGAPKGTGFLLRPREANGFSIRPGGGQESGQRAGTEDFAGIAALVAALTDAEQTKVLHETTRLQWRTAFEHDLRSALPGVRIVGDGAERLWNTVTLVLPEGEGARWVARLDQRGFAVAVGSACATGKSGGSAVLAALGYEPDEARRVIRISAGWDTRPEDWQALREALAAVRPEVRPSSAVVSA